MELKKLKQSIDDGLTIREIAKLNDLGYSTVRYWLRKHKLNTKASYQAGCDPNGSNGKKCLQCESELTGRKHMYCSNICKQNYHYRNQTNVNGNTNERQKRVGKERKIKLIKLKGGECKECGYKKNYSALVFHHKDPSNKAFQLDARKLANTKWDLILIEAAKCDLLCTNCHAETHHPDALL